MRTIYNPLYVQLTTTLRSKRQELGLTQEQLAKKMGTSRTFVVRVEQRERRLDILELHRWIDVLGMTLPDVEAILAGEKR